MNVNKGVQPENLHFTVHKQFNAINPYSVIVCGGGLYCILIKSAAQQYWWRPTNPVVQESRRGLLMLLLLLVSMMTMAPPLGTVTAVHGTVLRLGSSVAALAVAWTQPAVSRHPLCPAGYAVQQSTTHVITVLPPVVESAIVKSRQSPASCLSNDSCATWSKAYTVLNDR